MEKKYLSKKVAVISLIALFGFLFFTTTFIQINAIGLNNPAARESMPELYAMVDMVMPVISKVLSIF